LQRSVIEIGIAGAATLTRPPAAFTKP